MFLIIRYLPAGGITKTGACIAFLSLFCYYAGRAIVYLNLRTMGDRAVVVYTEPTIGFMITGVTIGAIVAAIGIVVGKKEKTNV